MPLVIAVVGSINVDLVSRVHHIPAPGETIRVESHAEFHGGEGANQAYFSEGVGHIKRGKNDRCRRG